MSAYRTHAEAFFAAHHAPLHPVGERLAVTLPPDLAAHFGAEALTLTFTPHDEGGELVAPGSRVFDLMAAWLAGRGRMAAFRVAALDLPAPAARAAAGALDPLPPTDAPRRYVIFDFLLAFLTDERAEHAWSVALDEAGDEAPEALGWLAAGGPAGDATAPGLDPAPWRHRAEALARAHAERLAAAIEAQAAARLAVTAGRLADYYEALIGEVQVKRRKSPCSRGRAEGAERSPLEAGLGEAQAERQALAGDRDRRLAEEARRHQLRVQVRLLGQAALEVPGRRLAWRLAGTDGAARLIEAWQDLATGQVAWPRCERCGDAQDTFGLCREGHLACAGCLAQCAACGASHCAAELATCDACGQATCPACLGQCAGQGAHPVCRSHLRGCACCGIAYCEACVGRCPGGAC